MLQPECFFHTLFDGYQSPGLMMELRRRDLPDEAGKRWCRSAWYPLDDIALTAAYRTALAWQHKGDVYFGVLPREGRQRDDQSVREASLLFVEIDGKEQGQAGALAFLHQSEVYEQFPPQIVVGSGGGCHVYFFLRQPCFLPGSSHTQHGLLQKRLCCGIGGQYWDGPNRLVREKSDSPYADPVSTNVSRVLRVPGTINHKRQQPVKIIETNPGAPKLSLEQWDSWLRPAPKAAYHQPKTREQRMCGKLPQRTKEAIDSSYSEGERYPALRSILRSARGMGWGASALSVLCDEFRFNNPGCKQEIMDMLVYDTMRRIHPD